MNRRELILAYGAWVSICLIWGTTYLAIRVAVRTLPDAWMAGVRFLVAGGLMILLLRLRGDKLPPARQWAHLAFIGISLVGFGNWLVVWSEKFVSSGTAALSVAAVPLWIVGLESVWRKRIEQSGYPVEGLNASKIAGLFVGFCGVALLMLPHLTGVWNQEYLIGILVLQIACFSWSIGSLYSKYKKLNSSALMSASVEMLLGGIFLCIIAAAKGEFSKVRWEPAGTIAFVYLIVFGAMIGFLSFIYALSKLPSSTVSMYAYINPVIAVWLGWLVLHEQVDWSTLAATLVILFGVWLVRRQPAARRVTV